MIRYIYSCAFSALTLLVGRQEDHLANVMATMVVPYDAELLVRWRRRRLLTTTTP